MSHKKTLISSFLATTLACTSLALAGGTPQHERHELMESVKDAAKVVGPMLQGEREYDNAAAMESLKTWKHVAGKFGALFPEGTETGEDTGSRTHNLGRPCRFRCGTRRMERRY